MQIGNCTQMVLDEERVYAFAVLDYASTDLAPHITAPNPGRLNLSAYVRDASGRMHRYGLMLTSNLVGERASSERVDPRTGWSSPGVYGLTFMPPSQAREQAERFLATRPENREALADYAAGRDTPLGRAAMQQVRDVGRAWTTGQPGVYQIFVLRGPGEQGYRASAITGAHEGRGHALAAARGQDAVHPLPGLEARIEALLDQPRDTASAWRQRGIRRIPAWDALER